MIKKEDIGYEHLHHVSANTPSAFVGVVVVVCSRLD